MNGANVHRASHALRPRQPASVRRATGFAAALEGYWTVQLQKDVRPQEFPRRPSLIDQVGQQTFL